MEHFKHLAKKLSALDNEVKLKMIALLTEKGALSITEISKELKLNFSTTHKYLEQLEKAGFLKSYTLIENRLKRLFHINDFDIHISPKILIDEKEEKRVPKKGLKVIDRNGRVIEFDIDELSKGYIGFGVPISTINEGARLVEEKAYDGITTLELKDIFEKFLTDKISSLRKSLDSLGKLNPEKRTYADVLKMLCPQALEMHKNGDIFIRNLSNPKILNFSHDLRGISIHSIGGKAPKTLSELFKQAIFAVKFINNLCYPVQGFDSFNYMIAPFASKLSKDKLYSEINDFLKMINKFNIKIYLGLDLGEPRYLNSVMTQYYDKPGEKSKGYFEFKNLVREITRQIVNIKTKSNLKNINLIFKIWDFGYKIDNFLRQDKPFYIANMKPLWQDDNAVYIHTTRLDYSWRGWSRLVRTGEIQDIVLNIPRLAYLSKSKDEFLKQIRQNINSIINFGISMSELNISKFIKEKSFIFKSSKRKQWNYLPIQDCRYSISIFGLNEAIKILTNKNLLDNSKFGAEILKNINEILYEQTTTSIRINLKECHNQDIIERFRRLDSKVYKVPAVYSPGSTVRGRAVPELHRFLKGGHCANLQIKDFDLKKILESGVGFVRIS